MSTHNISDGHNHGHLMCTTDTDDPQYISDGHNHGRAIGQEQRLMFSAVGVNGICYRLKENTVSIDCTGHKFIRIKPNLKT